MTLFLFLQYMDQKIAILDIGTNTFHLLIYHIKKGQSPQLIYKEKIFVKLAESGIHTIGPDSFDRGIAALNHYRAILDEQDPDNIFAFATAAMRTADNAEAFIKQAFKETDIQIKVISGEKEAELITKGVKMAVPFGDDPILIMDIGGGSTEFIAANKDNIFYSKSFPLGAAVVKRKFHHTEPITEEEIQKIYNYLEQELGEMLEELKPLGITTITGASGSFDTAAEMIYYPKTEEDLFKETDHVPIKIDDFRSILKKVKNSTLEERRNMNGLIPQRADLIVIALLEIDFIIQKLGLKHIILSNFAMKEGILQEFIEALD